MKRMSIFVPVLALALASCGGDPIASPGTVAPIAQPAPAQLVDAVVLQGHRTLTLAALGYDSAAKAATAAVRAGLIRGPALDTLKELNSDATNALSFGFTATSVAEKARAAVTLDGIVKRIRNLTAP